MYGLGRNDPCHCGSGKKYKKCHLRAEEAQAAAMTTRPGPVDRAQLPPEIRKKIEEIEVARAMKYQLYGHVRDIIHADFQGFKFVAVGSELHYSKSWKTFPDFLFDYIKTALNRAFGTQWAKDELAKVPQQRHPILRWYDDVCKAQAEAAAAHGRAPDGTFATVLDGPTAAYLTLAYDLYTMAHHGLLDSLVVSRLKHRDQFRSARYELAIAATVLRAGFTIAYEDETDTTRKHPEFLATHETLGGTVAVEAKSRWRSGVIEFKMERAVPDEFRLGVEALLNEALDKKLDMPLVVFIDTNMHPSIAFNRQHEWLREVAEMLSRTAFRGYNDVGIFEGVPFSLLALTNFPHDYAQRGEPDPGKVCYSSVPGLPKHPLPHPAMRDALEAALTKYGRIPQDFPKS